ncbi:hypothetical protein ACFYNO_32700 [Kitasatospora sp. NPDC006697]|uniref:hypothetical protein n=1 Tax=Kitasatospora sp. NPDC006697 TaxID=3364020 RepID=UPI0036C9D452
MDRVLIAAAPGTTWPLRREEFHASLVERFPEARCYEKHEPVNRVDYLGFYVDLDGTERHGNYFEGSHLTLEDAEPQEWAPTIEWFLTLLPVAAPVVAVLESNPDALAPLPPRATAEEIRAALAELITE